jgi:hypothetical protein
MRATGGARWFVADCLTAAAPEVALAERQRTSRHGPSFRFREPHAPGATGRLAHAKTNRAKTCLDRKKANCEWTTAKGATQDEVDKMNRENTFQRTQDLYGPRVHVWSQRLQETVTPRTKRRVTASR